MHSLGPVHTSVVWAYRTMCKTLTARALSKLNYEAGTIIAMDHVKPSPCIVAPVDMMVCEAQNEGFTQTPEIEHIRLKEEL